MFESYGFESHEFKSHGSESPEPIIFMGYALCNLMCGQFCHFRVAYTAIYLAIPDLFSAILLPLFHIP